MKSFLIIIFALSIGSLGFMIINNPVQTQGLVSNYANFLEFAVPVPTPSTQIVDLANKASMNDFAKNIFYRTNPEVISDRAQFNADCQAPVSSKTVELGCYNSNNKIYLLNISDERLSNQIVVTAAHELLHAAYTNLSLLDKKIINKELEDQLPLIKNKDLDTELKQYQLTEPGQRDNELHSIIGTEYAQINTDLEKYYSKYFTNRHAVTTFAQQFKDVFDNLQTQINNLGIQIKNIRSIMQIYLESKNIKQYNILVPQINILIANYNTDVDQYNQLSRNLIDNQSGITNSK